MVFFFRRLPITVSGSLLKKQEFVLKIMPSEPFPYLYFQFKTRQVGQGQWMKRITVRRRMELHQELRPAADDLRNGLPATQMRQGGGRGTPPVQDLDEILHHVTLVPYSVTVKGSDYHFAYQGAACGVMSRRIYLSFVALRRMCYYVKTFPANAPRH